MNNTNSNRFFRTCAGILAFLLVAILVSCGKHGKDGRTEFVQGEAAYADMDYKTAAQLFLDAAEKGNAEAQVRIGDCYWNGQGVKQDDAQALKWYFEAAKQMNPKGLYRIGVCYEEGRGITKDPEAAARWYQKAAGQQYPEAYFKLGDCCRFGRGMSMDEKAANKWYQKAVKAWAEAAEQGDAGAQYRLGECFSRGFGVEQNHTEAIAWYNKAAEQGNAGAQFELAKRFEEGSGGTIRNEVKAAEWYRKAAEQGHAEAQHRLAIRYETGNGVDVNLTEALKWYRKVAEQGSTNKDLLSKIDTLKRFVYQQKMAEQGDIEAMFKLAAWFETGNGLPKNLSEAVKWYQKAADLGNTEAQFELAKRYETGTGGVSRDETEAVKWYRKAAEHGYAEAQYKLALAYENGNNGVAKDISEAVKWYRKAAELKYPEASRHLQSAEVLLAAQNGNAEAQYKLALAHENGNNDVAKNLSEAVKWYRRAAEQGHGEAQKKLKTAELLLNAQNGNAEAQYKLAQAYENGSGVAEDLSEAMEWYHKAAELGHAEAQYKLATAYESGIGVEVNLSEALKWNRKAAEQGIVEAQYKLALAYENGTGDRADFSEAANWYRKAAEQDYVEAQYKLGVYFEKVKNDLSEAANWYRKAVSHGHSEAPSNLKKIELFLNAQNGNAEAQYKLGLAYEKGEGVEKDTSQAVSWFDLAAKQGHPGAKTAIQKYRLTIELPDGAAPLEMVRVTAGSFMMGETDGESRSTEKTHRATLTHDFFIARTEVTKKQSNAILGTPRFAVNSNPVDEISWYDAMDFCEKLNRMGKAPSGWKFTLPTETQWEYAARGGYARIGNVCEWCLDDWNEDSSAQKAEFSRGKGSERDSSFRVYRGAPSSSRNTNVFTVRSYGLSNNIYMGLGFRVALVQNSGNGSVSTTPINNRESRPMGAVRGTTSSSSTSTGITTSARQSQSQFDEIVSAAKKGNATAQYKLAQAYEKGTNGVKADGDEAIKWYKKAAEQGYADAQYRIGWHYYLGGSNLLDAFFGDDAIDWFRKAANQGHAEAQFLLGSCYQNAMGGAKKDLSEAFKWYRKAAEQGHPEAQFWVGQFYLQYVVGDEKSNKAKAAEWFRRAADQGNIGAKAALERM